MKYTPSKWPAGVALVLVGCSFLFTDTGIQTPRIPTDPQFVDCGASVENYRKRTQVFIDYTGSSLLRDYPLLVPVPADVLRDLHLQSNLADLHFTDGEGTELPYETELLDKDSTSFFWVQMTLGNNICRKSIWMYSDNPDEPEASPAPTWPDTIAIWHFTSDSDVQENSTSNNFNAIRAGDASLSFVGNGAIGVAQRNGIFLVDIPSSFVLSDESTWEARFFITNSEIINQRPLSYLRILEFLAIRDSRAEDFKVPAGYIATPEPPGILLRSNEPFTEGWHYIAIVVARQPGSPEKHATLYVDGVAKDNKDFPNFAPTLNTLQFSLGLPGGDIDEARLSSVVRNPNWIKNNQKAFEGTLIQFGTTDSL